MQLRFHTQTAGVSLTAQQPEVNIVRTAIEALAGVLGGTQSLHTNSMDEALALPTEKAARIALRTQQVIAHETDVAHVADPLGGSWYVEALTDEIERQAEEMFAHLDELGGGSMLEGVIDGIEDNWFQGEIADAAYDLERRFNTGRRIVVGVNAFTEGNDDDQIPIAADHQRGRGTPAEAPRSRCARRATDAAVDAALRRRRGRGRRPRGQPDAGAHRRRQRLRHARRGHGGARRRVRPPRRSPDHLTAPMTDRAQSSSPRSASTATTAASRSSPASCATPAIEVIYTGLLQTPADGRRRRRRRRRRRHRPVDAQRRHIHLGRWWWRCGPRVSTFR